LLVAIHQPNYFPWIGYIDKLLRSDKFVILDNVQYAKRDYQNRTRILAKNSQGWIWLTVPVLTKNRYYQVISEVGINPTDTNWQWRHYRALEMTYGRNKYFYQCYPFLRDIYMEKRWLKLAELNCHIIYWLASKFNCQNKLILASELGVTGRKSQLLLNICQKIGADSYLSGDGARCYLDTEIFRKSGIKVFFQNFQTPKYWQFLNKDFTPDLSIVDLICHHGFEAVTKLLLDKSTLSKAA
jgi:hypothetical protein